MSQNSPTRRPVAWTSAALLAVALLTGCGHDPAAGGSGGNPSASAPSAPPGSPGAGIPGTGLPGARPAGAAPQGPKPGGQ